MDRLCAFLKRFGRGARAWVGPRPQVREGQMQRAIAAMVGYPSTGEAWSDAHKLEPVDRATAAQLLARVATTSLPYGPSGPPRESYRRMAAGALDDLGPEAVFLTYAPGTARGGSYGIRKRLSTATFEAGLIAYDAAHAFIYWVEEED